MSKKRVRAWTTNPRPEVNDARVCVSLRAATVSETGLAIEIEIGLRCQDVPLLDRQVYAAQQAEGHGEFYSEQ